jgi:hypothetical protein
MYRSETAQAGVFHNPHDLGQATFRYTLLTPTTPTHIRLKERWHENSEPNISSECESATSRRTSIQRKYEDCFRNCASGWASASRRLRLSGWRCHLPKTAMTSPRRFSSPKATGWRRPTRFSIRPENSLPRRFCVINREPSFDLSACCPRFTAVIGKSAVLQPASASDLRRDHSERNLRKLLCSHSSSGSFGGDAT